MKNSFFFLFSLLFNLLSEWNILGQWYSGIVVLFVVVHPYFGRATRVFRKYITTTPWECVWMSFPEYMSHSRTRNDFQRSTTRKNEYYLFYLYSIQYLCISIYYHCHTRNEISRFSPPIEFLTKEKSQMSMKLFPLFAAKTHTQKKIFLCVVCQVN